MEEKCASRLILSSIGDAVRRVSVSRWSWRYSVWRSGRVFPGIQIAYRGMVGGHGLQMRNAYDPVVAPFLSERVDTIRTSRGWRSLALVLRLSGHLYSLLFACALLPRDTCLLWQVRRRLIFSTTPGGNGQARKRTHVVVPLPQFPLGRRPCTHTFQHVCQVVNTIPRHVNRVKFDGWRIPCTVQVPR